MPFQNIALVLTLKHMDINTQKHQLRQKMRAQRDALDPAWKELYDQAINTRLITLVEERDFHIIHCYLPMGSEININPFIQECLSRKLTVVAPKTLKNRKLDHLVLENLEQTEEGLFGTKHPRSGKVFSESYDLIIVPGLAYDKDKYRLGYGGGYYDTFLSENKDAFKLGIAYPFQICPSVPTEPHDIKLDEVLTVPL